MIDTRTPPLPGRFEARLLEELRGVVAERPVASSPPSAPRVRRRGAGHRRAAILVALVVLAGGTALAATTPWNPQVGGDDRGHPSVATTPLPADQLAVLAVLRRPQSDADRGPRVQAALKALPSSAVARVHVESARLLQAWTGGAAILLAAGRFGLDVGSGGSQVNDALCLMIQSDHQTVAKDGAVSQVYAPSTSSNCGTTEDLKAGHLLLSAEIDGRLQLTGIVPDGVAHVTLTLRDGQVLAAPVVDNAFHIDARVPRGAYEDAPVHWLDGRGDQVPKAR